MNNGKREPLAIVGLSAIFPGSVDRHGFWSDILRGKDLIRDIPESHWLIEDYYDPDPSTPDKTYGKRGGFLEDIEFDPISWGVPPNIMSATDTTQLLALIVAKRCLEDACGGDFSHLDRSRVSVILGATSSQELLNNMVSRLQRPMWVKALREHGVPEEEVTQICDGIASNYVPWQESTFPGLLGNVIAGRIANRLDLGGTNCVTDAACASTFSAISMAASELYLGDSDMVLVGGADTLNDIFMHMCFSKTPALSKSGDVRPFSDQADGTLLGEGIGMFAIRRLSDAEKDGDPIYALLTGVGTSSDGRSKSVYAPRSSGQAKAIRRAYKNAGISPSEVELVEAHGTGTKAGDAAEFDGLNLVFTPELKAGRQWCALGTVKSQIGHTKAAAGAAGLFKAVMSLHHAIYPPTIKIDQPNPNLNIEQTALYLNTYARPWIRAKGKVRNAGVSSFGFGGSNFHLALQEYRGPNQAKRIRTWSSELLLWRTATESDLKSKLGLFVENIKSASLAHLAKQSIRELGSGAHQLGIVASSVEDLKKKIKTTLGQLEGRPFSSPKGIHYGIGKQSGKIAFLFPGQGSQHLEMGSDLLMAYPTARQAWDEVAGNQFDGLSLHQVVFPPPSFSASESDSLSSRVTQTEWAQPAIGVASMATMRLLNDFGLFPDAVAGHSYGELSALHAAGTMSTTDFISVSRKRGELMRDAAVTPGSMSAVKSNKERLAPLLEEWGLGVVIANHNSPRQCVISGPTDAVSEVERRLKDAGILAQRLNVATAFHSSVVSDSVEPFSKFLSEIKLSPPKIAVYANSTAKPYPESSKEIRQILSHQIASSVRYVELIEAMAKDGVSTFIEVGPRNIQSQLVKQILKGKAEVRSIATDRKRTSSLVAFLDALAQIHTLGIQLKWDKLFESDGLSPDPRQVEAPKMSVLINGTNYGKPYPPKNGAAGLPKPNPPKPVEVAMAQKKPPPPPPAASRQASPHQTKHAPQSGLGQASSEWLLAFQHAQAQTAQAHAAYQSAMSEAHLAYLQTMQQSLQGLAHLAGAPQSALAPLPSLSPMVAPVTPVATPQQPQPQPTQVHVQAVSVQAARVQPRTTQSLPQHKTVIDPAPSSQSTPIDIPLLLLSVVSENTGYPTEMLSLDMSLEGDLGIDSIKRVEILSAVQEQAPSLPEVDAGAMATLQTLGQIIDFLNAQSPDGSQEVTPSNGANGDSKILSQNNLNIDIPTLLLEVVSEKTGYPTNMLSLEMSLEGDLGIDSIKRVEILSAVQEKAPSLPEVDAAAMSSLQTLGQIIDHLNNQESQTIPASDHPPLDLAALLLTVVSEKTGYPPEMLNLEMSLEGDLGIDSIKRVEILSAIQERDPTLPEVDAGAMAALQTLGQIVGHMQEQSVNFSQAEPSKTDDSASTPIPRYKVVLESRPQSGLCSSTLHTAKIGVLSSDDSLKSALTKQLKSFDLTVVKNIGKANLLIDLRPLRVFKSDDDALTCPTELFESAHALGKGAKGLVVALDTGGHFSMKDCPLRRALSAGVAGIVKTAAQEWPTALCKVLDIERRGRTPSEMANIIVNELVIGGGTLEVGFPISGDRLVPVLQEEALHNPDMLLNENDICFVSGGGRGVTAQTMIALATQTKAKFAFVGRTVLKDDPCPEKTDLGAVLGFVISKAKESGQSVGPKAARLSAKQILASREINETLRVIRSVGAQAEYYSADVCDGDRLKVVCASIRNKWGKPTVLVHGAGVLADKKIIDKTQADFSWVFDVKVRGAKAMLEATKGDPLRWVCFFSSVAARTGNNGQCDYAAANETLNKWAWALQNERPNCTVKAMGWGPWEGGMVTPSLKSHFESMGVPLIPLRAGADALCLECSTNDGVELIFGAQGLDQPMVSQQYSLFLHKALQPEYLDHQIQGTVVLPMAMVLEYFLQACKDFRPKYFVHTIRDLHVLKGVKLPKFSGKGHRLSLHTNEIAPNTLELQLREGDLPLYTAQADLSSEQPKPIEHPTLEVNGKGALEYGQSLFHGPRFQMIQDLELVKDGLQAQLSTAKELGWQCQKFVSDPVGVDATLQLALLWVEQKSQQKSVPMSIERISFGSANILESTRCVLQPRDEASTKLQLLSDGFLLDDKGQCSMSLSGVRTVIYSGAK